MSMSAFINLPHIDADACESLFNQLCMPSDTPEQRRELAQRIVNAYSWPKEAQMAVIDHLSGRPAANTN